MTRVSTTPNFFVGVNSLEDRIASLERAISQITALNTSPDWIAPTLGNSWANVGSGFETAGYLKDPLGFVHMKGYIQSGSNGTIAFTLPVGYRPGAIANYPAWESAGNGQWAGIRVDPGGAVTIYISTAVQVSLSVPPFLAEN